MTRLLWVVEMWERKRWVPTCGAYLSRSFAREQLVYDWQYANPRKKFRIVKYVPQSLPQPDTRT